MRAVLRLLSTLPLLGAAGCTTPMLVEVEGSGDFTAAVEHQPLVAVVAARGGNFGGFVNLYSGNLFLDWPVLDVSALGFDFDVRLFYNSSLASEVTVCGAGWRLSYDMRLEFGVPAPGHMTVRWGDGRRDAFAPGGPGWLPDQSLLGSYIVSAGPDFVLRTKHGSSYVFDAAGQLARLVDRNNNATILTWSGGKLVAITDPAGRTVNLGYAVSGQLESISGLTAAPIQLSHSGNRLVGLSDAAGNLSQYQYDARDRLVRVIDAEGVPLDITYHPSPTVSCVTQVAVGTSTRAFAYNPFVLTTVVTDVLDGSRTHRTAYTLDSNGLCLAVRTDEGTTANTYDPVLRVRTSYTDVNNRAWSWTYDALGNRLSRTDPTGATESYTYDPTYNFAVTAQDASGNTWSRTLDAQGNTLTASNPVGGTTTFTYTPQGQVQTLTSPNGGVTSYAYTLEGDLAIVTDAGGAQLKATYNGRGRPLDVTDQEGNVTAFAYDALERLIRIAPPTGGVWEIKYTRVGRIGTVRDPLGAQWRYAYDARHLLASLVEPTGAVTTWQRDGGGHIVAVVDALGRIESRALDVFGRLLRRVDPEGNTWTRVPAPGDATQPASVTDPLGNMANFTYSPRYELAGTSWPAGPIDVQRTYDAPGRLIRITRSDPLEPLTGYEYAYNGAGWLIAATALHIGRTTSCAYDADGNVTNVTDNLRPAGAVSYGYDSRDLPTSAAVAAPGLSAGVTTTARYQLRGLAYSTGATASYAYDAASRLVSIQNAGAGFAADYAFHYDAADQLSRIAGAAPATGPHDVQLGRDVAGRLTDEVYPLAGTGIHYDLDLVGNRLQKVVSPGMPDVYTYSPAHRLLQVATAAGPVNQVWSADGHVVHVDKPGGYVADLQRRADRTLKSIAENGLTWRFTPGPYGEIVRVVDPAAVERWYGEDRVQGTLLRRVEMPGPSAVPTDEYVYLAGGGGGREGEPVPAMWLFAPYDRVSLRVPLAGPDGVAQVASNTGALVSDVYYDRFGNRLAALGAIMTRQGFAGMDGEPNLRLWLTANGAVAMAPDATYDPDLGSFHADAGFGNDGFADRAGYIAGMFEAVPTLYGPKTGPYTRPNIGSNSGGSGERARFVVYATSFWQTREGASDDRVPVVLRTLEGLWWGPSDEPLWVDFDLPVYDPCRPPRGAGLAPLGPLRVLLIEQLLTVPTVNESHSLVLMGGSPTSDIRWQTPGPPLLKLWWREVLP